MSFQSCGEKCLKRKVNTHKRYDLPWFHNLIHIKSRATHRNSIKTQSKVTIRQFLSEILPKKSVTSVISICIIFKSRCEQKEKQSRSQQKGFKFFMLLFIRLFYYKRFHISVCFGKNLGSIAKVNATKRNRRNKLAFTLTNHQGKGTKTKKNRKRKS